MSTYESDSGGQTEETPEEAKLRRLVASVYQKCWNEFYEWEPTYCREELKKLGSNSVDQSYDSVWADIEEWEEDSNATSTESLKMVQIHLGQQLVPSDVKVKTVKLAVNFPPVPPYEFCMPINRSINCMMLYEQETSTQGRMLWSYWCPFVDPDESFPSSQRDLLLEITELEWESQIRIDNDIDMILIETLSRLKNLPYKKIEELNLLPRPVTSAGSDMGILDRWHSRAPLTEIPFNWTPLDDLPSYKVQIERGELIRNWCPLCVEFECLQHIRSQPVETTAQSGPRPQMIKVDRQCGEDCIFNHIDSASMNPSVIVVKLLEDFLFEGDSLEWTTSCEIAKIIAQPCWQVYMVMAARLEDQQKFFDISSEKGNERRTTKYIHPPGVNEYIPYEPCAHPGPCVDCSCVEAKGWCSAGCRCAEKCHRRPRGCSCVDSCSTEKDCVCRRENRECEPGRCGSCWPTDGETHCKNAPIQRRESRKTEVRRAEFGWGLFALENIEAGDYVINYTGEIYSTDTSEPRRIVAEYLRRNYNFGLGDKIDVDAYAAGNESRVINDPLPGEPKSDRINCVVKYIWAAGDFHLAIFASKPIRRGQELFLSYGENFWTSSPNPPVVIPRENKKPQAPSIQCQFRWTRVHDEF